MGKWLARAAVALVVSATAFGAFVWIGSELVLRKSYARIPAVAPTVRGDVESGKHWAAILGCTSCHGSALQGSVMEDEGFWIGLLAAPNVTIQRKLYDDGGLARLIRDGVKHDGRGVDTMPSNAFHQADDQTIADVIAFVRSVPDGGDAQPKIGYGPLARWKFLTGEWKLAPDEIDGKAARIGDDSLGQSVSSGRYIAVLACGECHGLDQKGDPDGGVPNLAVAKAYSLEEFTGLMHDGEAKGGRKIRPMMAQTARQRFSVFNAAEIAALKSFLDAREP
jgi:mono/diheme cytochrome c family protein